MLTEEAVKILQQEVCDRGSLCVEDILYLISDCLELKRLLKVEKEARKKDARLSFQMLSLFTEQINVNDGLKDAIEHFKSIAKGE